VRKNGKDVDVKINNQENMVNAASVHFFTKKDSNYLFEDFFS